MLSFRNVCRFCGITGLCFVAAFVGAFRPCAVPLKVVFAEIFAHYIFLLSLCCQIRTPAGLMRAVFAIANSSSGGLLLESPVVAFGLRVCPGDRVQAVPGSALGFIVGLACFLAHFAERNEFFHVYSLSLSSFQHKRSLYKTVESRRKRKTGKWFIRDKSTPLSLSQ